MTVIPQWTGVLEHIYLCEIAGEEMREMDTAVLVEERGIEGDRYFLGTGHYSPRPHRDRQVTLIERETLDTLARDHNIVLLPEESRRNFVTRGVPLAHLVGKKFRVGETVLYGGRLNVPCMYLEELLGKPVFQPLVNRSGLNCQIISGGQVRSGDPIGPVLG